MSPESELDPQEFGEVAEEVVVTSEDLPDTGSSNAVSLPDHDYNIYRVNRRARAAAKAADALAIDAQGKRNLDDQMEAVAQSVAAAAQEKEKLKRKRGSQTVMEKSIYQVNNLRKGNLINFLFLLTAATATGKRYPVAQLYARGNYQTEQSRGEE